MQCPTAAATADLFLTSRPAPAVAQAPAKPVSGTYSIDSGHSQVLFTVTHFGVSEYTGQYTGPTGTLVLDTANAANDKVDVTFPIAKVSTTVRAMSWGARPSWASSSERLPCSRNSCAMPNSRSGVSRPA